MALETAFWGCAGLLGALTAGLWLCLAESVRLFRGASPAEGPLLPMTLVKPLKGLDEGLEENFEAIAAADPGRSLQVIAALESEDDPACAVVRRFAARHPDRDVLVLITGPSRGRMGKAHNMIEALPRAKHPRVIFSDSDVETTPRLLAETSRAFERGYEAVFAVPRQRRGRRPAEVLFEIAMNHSFGLTAALGWRAVGFTHCAGAWMAYTREILERSGGLEPISHAIADDFALSQRAAKAGARGCLVPAPALLREGGGPALEIVEHLVKWARIIRWSVPIPYLMMPLFNIAVVSAATLALARAGGGSVAAAWALTAAAFASRGLVACLQDAIVGEGALSPAWYAVVAFTDVGALGFWAAGFPRRIVWRGVRYRLFWGGRSEVLSAP